MAKAKNNGGDIFVDLDPNNKSNAVEDVVAEVVSTETSETKKDDNIEITETKPKTRKGRTNKINDKAEETLSSKSTESETINLGDLKQEQKKETVTIDFMNQSESEEFIAKKTKTSKLTSDLEEKVNGQSEDRKSEFEGKTTDEIRDQILKEEEAKSNSFKPSDYEEIASMVVNVIDMLLSSLLKWWAKDTSDTAYSLNAKKKQTVSYQLTLILIKHQKKWSIEFMFILTLIAVYSGPVLAANRHRKQVKEKEGRTKGKPQKH